ncbi:hypothetical protein UlMin_019091 [Ulmus minor]
MANPNPRAIAAAIVVLITIIIAGESDGRELRPSDHGLDYQESPPPGEKSPQMVTFFGGGGGEKEGSSPSSNMPMPRAMNSNDTTWWKAIGGRTGNGKDRVRQDLVVASLVCGITGVALLVVSGLLYIFKFKRQKSTSTSPPPPPAPPLCDNNAITK